MLDRLFAEKEMRIVMLGIGSAGKTTNIYKLRLSEAVQTVPTIGFNVESLEYNNLKFVVWDTCGGEKNRRFWKHYLGGTERIIIVVDSSDRERLGDVKYESD